VWRREGLLPSPLPNPESEERQMAYVTEKRGVFYAVIAYTASRSRSAGSPTRSSER
jgi:hypothetical protein